MTVIFPFQIFLINNVHVKNIRFNSNDSMYALFRNVFSPVEFKCDVKEIYWESPMTKMIKIEVYKQIKDIFIINIKLFNATSKTCI